MQRLTITVPRFYNDGKHVESYLTKQIESDILNLFGGYSRVDVNGEWTDANDKIYQDESYRYEILTLVTHDLGYYKLKEYAVDLCKILHQNCILTTYETIESVDYVS